VIEVDILDPDPGDTVGSTIDYIGIFAPHCDSVDLISWQLTDASENILTGQRLTPAPPGMDFHIRFQNVTAGQCTVMLSLLNPTTNETLVVTQPNIVQ